MLKKLMKYDFVRVEKVVIWALLAVLVCAAAARLTNAIYNEKMTMLWLIVDKIASALAIVVMIFAVFLTFFRTAASFVRTVYGKQSYFTHTLPVKRGAVYDAKVLCGLAMNLLTLLAVGAGAAIVFLTGDTMALVKAAWKDSGAFYLLAAVTFVLEVLCFAVCAYLGIVLGHMLNTHKIFLSVVFTLVLWNVISTVLIGAEAVFYFANGNIADFLRADTASFAMDAPMPQEVKTVFVVAAAGYALMISVLYFIGRRLLVKGVNVD